MFPPVHPGVGYLLYAGLTRVHDAVPSGNGVVLAVVVGAAVPDLIDQPLYYLLALPSTRTLGHSLLSALPVSLLAIALVRRSDVPNGVGIGFAIGYLSHLPADALWPLLLGKFRELGFLLWPITLSPDYEGTKELFSIGAVTVTTLWVELSLLAVAFLVWRRDEMPGIEPVMRLLGK